MKLSQLKEITKSNIFREYLVFAGLSPKSRPFLIYQPIAVNEKLTLTSFSGFFDLSKLCT